MKYRRLILTLLLLPLWHIARAQDYSSEVLSWPEITLKLTKDMPLADVFDSGFRPYRWPGEGGNMSVGFRHVRLVVQTRSGIITPRMPMERCEIRVRGSEQKVVSMEFISPPLTVQESRAEMLKWLPLGTSRKAPESEMEEFLFKVNADWLHYEYEGTQRMDFNIYWEEAEGVRYTVYFMNARHWDTPLRLVLFINNQENRKRQKFRTVPVVPPPGYESVDMALPPGGNWGPDDIYVPVTNEPRSPRGSLPPGVKLPETFPNWEEIRKSKSGAVKPRDSESLHQSPQSLPGKPAAASKKWLWAAIFTLAAVGLLWFLRKNRK